MHLEMRLSSGSLKPEVSGRELTKLRKAPLTRKSRDAASISSSPSPAWMHARHRMRPVGEICRGENKSQQLNSSFTSITKKYILRNNKKNQTSRKTECPKQILFITCCTRSSVKSVSTVCHGQPRPHNKSCSLKASKTPANDHGVYRLLPVVRNAEISYLLCSSVKSVFTVPWTTSNSTTEVVP